MTSRAEALDRIRRAVLRLNHMAERIADPAYDGEPLADDIARADCVFEVITTQPASRRAMDLVDAIGLCADSGVQLERVGALAGGWSFDPEALRAAVKAWRAPPPRGRGSGRTATLWPLVADALRSAGVAPPSPESLRKEHERWRKARGRPAR
jgi:hypothetical protein